MRANKSVEVLFSAVRPYHYPLAKLNKDPGMATIRPSAGRVEIAGVTLVLHKAIGMDAIPCSEKW